MHDNVIRLYKDGMISNTGLARAVGHGWITVQEFEDLTGDTYSPPVDYEEYYNAMKEVLK